MRESLVFCVCQTCVKPPLRPKFSFERQEIRCTLYPLIMNPRRRISGLALLLLWLLSMGTCYARCLGDFGPCHAPDALPSCCGGGCANEADAPEPPPPSTCPFCQEADYTANPLVVMVPPPAQSRLPWTLPALVAAPVLLPVTAPGLTLSAPEVFRPPSSALLGRRAHARGPPAA